MRIARYICILISSALLLLLGGTSFAQSFQESLSTAEKGDVFAQYQTGLNYYYGQGVPIDKGKAAEWFEKSVDGGLPWAAGLLSEMYLSGDGVKKDPEKGKHYAEEADKYVVDTMLHPEKYAFVDEHLREVAEDQTRELLAQAQSGDLEAQKNVAQNYEQGLEGFEQNDVQAFAWYKRAAAQGDATSMYAIAQLLVSSDKVALDLSPQATIDEAVAWMKKAIEAGWGLPQDIVRFQELTPEGLAEARLYGRINAAEQVLICAQIKTLPCSDEDKRQALLVIRQAAEDGNNWAQYLWGAALLQSDMMRLLGQAVDPTGAISFLLKASENDVPEAMMLVAKQYERGDIVAQNLPAAMSLYDRVIANYKKNNASGGDGSEAECRLHYLRGDKLEPYQEEACSWIAHDYEVVAKTQ
ncbi:tetratricopeptide repeat protein [Asticcacaulis taihuensis]|uniref:tetratricopeptide repeat protein n=1 Tax=Asticcacaulis taihuensis TaxID=260084 RepID=UPI003F7C1831